MKVCKLTNRIDDINGWFEVKDNPLSKVGVFPYLGSTVDYDGALGLDPDKTYMVLRSAEELRDDACVDSFKLLPWIDDHEMLGTDSEGLTPAESKGVQGVIGEDVYFDETDETLKGNLKVFSESLKESIDLGKEELSCGYRCKYTMKRGIFNGTKYDVIQTDIRGNHLALVDEGRMGPDVSVMDGADRLCFTTDSKEFVIMPKPEAEDIKDIKDTQDAEEENVTQDMTMPEVTEVLKKIMPQLSELMKASQGESAEDEKEDPSAEDADEEGKAEDEDDESNGEDRDDEKEKGSGMDSMKKQNKALQSKVRALTISMDGFRKGGMKTLLTEISKRDSLASSVSAHVGTFDHAQMDLSEVAKYGVKKLGLTCDGGQEIATLNGFFHNRTPAIQSYALDSAQGNSSEVDAYLSGVK